MARPGVISKTSAVQASSQAVKSTPAPKSASCPQCDAAKASLTLGALASRQRDHRTAACAGALRYSAGWADRLPADLPLYPDARVSEAAGSQGNSCALRAVSFSTGASLQQVMDWYYTRATNAGWPLTTVNDALAYVKSMDKEKEKKEAAQPDTVASASGPAAAPATTGAADATPPAGCASAGDVSEQSCPRTPASASHARAAVVRGYNACRSRRAHAAVASDAGTAPWVHACSPCVLRAAAPVVMTIVHFPPDISVKICCDRAFKKRFLRNAKSYPNIIFFPSLFSSFVIVLLPHIVSFCSGIIHRTARAHIYILLRDISQAIIRR